MVGMAAEVGSRARAEWTFVLILCCLAAVRVFVFSAAFPFFNHVDEDQHFDLVYKYSSGRLPTAELESIDFRAAELIVLYHSPEYLSTPAEWGKAGFPPPRWTNEEVAKSKHFAQIVSKRAKHPNYQTASPPVYYAAAGAWCNLGRGLGFQGGQLLYWIRFLNALIIAAIVWTSYGLARSTATSASPAVLLLPALVAFFPHDVFYLINSDALSPLLFAIAFLMMIHVRYESRSLGYHIVAGIMVAATLLTELSNLAIFVALAVVVVLAARDLLRGRLRREAGWRLGALVASALLPVAWWVLRNATLFGNATATDRKVRYLGWVAKPFGEMWNHPLFSLEGFSFFFAQLTRTFWRGGVLWHLEEVIWPPLDFFFVGSTGLFIAVACVGLIRERRTGGARHFALSMGVLSLAVSVLFLMVMSLRFDFGESKYPSRDVPYFVSGRLILGVLVPFLLIYLDGLARCLRKLKRSTPAIAVASLVLIVTAAEFWLHAEVFRSRFNWYHLD
jgi:hypothetical protein